MVKYASAELKMQGNMDCVTFPVTTYSQYLGNWVFIPIQGPVVQSFASLTSSLRVIMLTVLVDSTYNILIFFAEKMRVAFALQKLLTFFFSKKFQHICVSLDVNFHESVTNDIFSFEQLGGLGPG